MLSWLKNCLVSLLPTVAMLSLVGGPSPLAAYAECCDRLARQQDAKRKAGGEPSGPNAPVGCEDEPGPNGSGNAPAPEDRQPDKPKTIPSFMAPKAAKPSDGKATDFTLVPRTRHASGFGPGRGWFDVSCGQIASLQILHNPAYWAQGPPADSIAILLAGHSLVGALLF